MISGFVDWREQVFWSELGMLLLFTHGLKPSIIIGFIGLILRKQILKDIKKWSVNKKWVKK